MLTLSFYDGRTVLASLCELGVMDADVLLGELLFDVSPINNIALHAYGSCIDLWSPKEVSKVCAVTALELLSPGKHDVSVEVDGAGKGVEVCSACFEDVNWWLRNWANVKVDTDAGVFLQLLDAFPTTRAGQQALRLLVDKATLWWAVTHHWDGSVGVRNLACVASSFPSLPSGLPARAYELHAVADQKIAELGLLSEPAFVTADASEGVWVAVSSRFSIGSTNWALSRVAALFEQVYQVHDTGNIVLVRAAYGTAWQGCQEVRQIADAADTTLEVLLLALKQVPYGSANFAPRFREALQAARACFI